jgi:hypothetical protein
MSLDKISQKEASGLFPPRSIVTWEGTSRTVANWSGILGMPIPSLQENLANLRSWDDIFQSYTKKPIRSKPTIDLPDFAKGGIESRRKESEDMALKKRQKNFIKGEGRRLLRKALIYSEGGKCIDCGWSEEHSVLQHHHRDPKTKRDTIPQLCGRAARRLANIQSLLDEANKCDLLCPTCHSMRHFKIRNSDRS